MSVATADRVRITGVGVLCGAGRGADTFWQAMRDTAPGLATASLGDTRFTEPRYVAVPTLRDPLDDDLAAHWLSLVVDDALSASAAALARLQAPRLALFGGSSLGGMTRLEAQQRSFWANREAGPGMLAPSGPVSRGVYDGPVRAVGSRSAIAGSAWAINTACSSAANALGVARRMLRRRRIDVAVVAGVDVVSPFVYAGFASLGALDMAPSTPFGAERRGLNLGEGAVAFVLMRAEDAPDTDAVDIVGYGSSCDAHHLTRPDLGGLGLARAITACLRDGKATPHDIAFISAHGTGTPYNDTMEDAAYRHVFGEQTPPVHCAKPVTGHTLGAAGAIDALLCLLALRHRVLPRTYRRGEADSALRFTPATHEHALTRDALALSTSSGFGGSNAALLLQRGSA